MHHNNGRTIARGVEALWNQRPSISDYEMAGLARIRRIKELGAPVPVYSDLRFAQQQEIIARLTDPLNPERL